MKCSGVRPGPQVFGRVNHAPAEAPEARAIAFKAHAFEGPGRQAQVLSGFRLREVGSGVHIGLHRYAACVRRMDV